jgi:branched-chain amino acid transport system ATP-binding protein
MLRLESVSAGYGATEVLRGVSLSVPTSSVVALLGANGAGKTTLLRVATGLLPLRSGRVVVDRKDMTGRSPHELVAAGVCHIPEGRGIFRSLTVKENLLLQALGGDDEEALERATAAFPLLAARMRQIAGTLSGGEQQMLALARAYVQRPRVVLLDEVSMGLAPRVVDEIFEFIARLGREGSACCWWSST